MTATASEPIHPGSPGAAPHRVARDRDGAHHDDAVELWRWSSVLMGSVELLAVVWSVPLAVLLVGSPIALTIVLLLWLGRLALNAF
jgi:hypothetical protein